MGEDEGCNMPTVEDRTHTSFVMQFLSKEHPVVTCALKAYDDQSSDLTLCFNEAENDSKLQMTCIVRMLHRCMEEKKVECAIYIFPFVFNHQPNILLLLRLKMA